MKRFVKKQVIFILTGMVILLAGCGEGNNFHKNSDPNSDLQSLNESPDLSYDMPENIPGILTGMSGYETKNRKVVLFHGKNLPDSFEVVDAKTHEVVFTAELSEKEYNANTDEYNSYGDFSGLHTPGEYYVQCDLLGRSYSFVIQDELYKEAFVTNFTVLSDREGRSGETAEVLCTTAASLLISYELYPQVYEDGVFYESNQIPDVLDEVALIVAELSQKQDIQTGKVENITDCYAGVLAKFSYLYQKYDSTYATECLKAADLAWQYTVSEREEISAEQHFFAAAELYRATGQQKYHQAAKECAAEILKKDIFEDDYALFGTVTYLSTKRTVDVDVCTRLMQMLMSMAEDIINESKSSFYLACGQREDIQGIFSPMMLLSVANYISTNQEYAVVIENHYHYLCGRNPWAQDLLQEADLQQRGYLLMMLSQMLQADLVYKE